MVPPLTSVYNVSHCLSNATPFASSLSEDALVQNNAEVKADNELASGLNDHTGSRPENAEEDAGHEDPEAAAEAVEEAEEAAEAVEEAENRGDETEQDENSGEDDDLSPEARAIIEGYKRLTGGRPDPRMGWGVIPDRYK